MGDKRQINGNKAKALLSNQVGYGPLGHKTVKHNNHKVITVGQSPATWDRTHPRNLLQMTAKGKPGCHSPAFGKRSHTNYNLLVRQYQTKLAV